MLKCKDSIWVLLKAVVEVLLASLNADLGQWDLSGVLGDNKVCVEGVEGWGKSLLRVGHSILRTIKDLEWLRKFCYG